MNLLQIDYEKLQSSYALVNDSLTRLPPLVPSLLNNSLAMEPYDALASRFERLVEIALNRFFRSVELHQFGKKSESLRDRLLNMQKIGLVNSVELWMEMRDFRNRIAHDYLPEQLVAMLNTIRDRFREEIDLTIAQCTSFVSRNQDKKNVPS